MRALWALERWLGIRKIYAAHMTLYGPSASQTSRKYMDDGASKAPIKKYDERYQEFLSSLLDRRPLYIYTCECIFMHRSAGDFFGPRFSVLTKYDRHNAIRELVASAAVASQDELRRKLVRRGFDVTQATL